MAVVRTRRVLALHHGEGEGEVREQLTAHLAMPTEDISKDNWQQYGTAEAKVGAASPTGMAPPHAGRVAEQPMVTHRRPHLGQARGRPPRPRQGGIAAAGRRALYIINVSLPVSR